MRRPNFFDMQTNIYVYISGALKKDSTYCIFYTEITKYLSSGEKMQKWKFFKIPRKTFLKDPPPSLVTVTH